jgi:hypothetical protein
MDVTLVKGKFLIEENGYSGIFLAFFNFINEYIANVTSVISSKTALFDATNLADNWEKLYQDVMAYKQGTDLLDSQNFTYFLIDSFVGYDVFPDVRDRNIDDLTGTLYEIIAKALNVGSVKCQIDFEFTSSLAMEMAGIVIDMPGGGKSTAGDLPEDERIKKIESGAKYIIDGVAVVAPVRGKSVNELNAGDKIKVLLPGKDLITEKILKLLNAYEVEGERLPITGRIKAKVPNDQGGFILYAVVAKGVLAKIYEEENVKIMIEQPSGEIKTEKLRKDKWVIYIMGIIVGLIILCGIILFQLL